MYREEGHITCFVHRSPDQEKPYLNPAERKVWLGVLGWEWTFRTENKMKKIVQWWKLITLYYILKVTKSIDCKSSHHWKERATDLMEVLANAWWWQFGDIYGGASVGEPACQCRTLKETWVWPLGQKDSLEEGMAALTSFLAWRVPLTEEPNGLWSVGSQRIRHNWSNLACRHSWEQPGFWVSQHNRWVDWESWSEHIFQVGGA